MMCVLCVVSFYSSRALTSQVRVWALSHAMMDVPNARSLHVTPTPRGGGLAIVIVVLALEALLLASGLLGADLESAPWGWAGWIATLCLALIGLQDDLKSLSAARRLVLQLAVCAAWTIWTFGITTDLPAMIALVLQILAMVWLVNLYNFMDGSDGLAATQAIGASAFGGLLAWWLGLENIAYLSLLVAGSSAGFLYWNWQPAKIFLGDVGSYFLGGQFAILSAATVREGQLPWFWAILLGPFVVDASLTLARRIMQGERWLTAHRTHAYQLLTQSGWSHGRVARGLAWLIVFICFPLATVSVWRPALAPYCMLLAYTVLATIWFRIVFLATRHPA